MKILKIILCIGIFVAGVAMFQSFQYEWIEFDEPEIPDVVSLSGDLVPIFEARCNSNVCHGGGVAPDLRPDNAYNSLIMGGFVNVDEPETSSIYTCLLPGGSMVQYAAPGDAELVLAWIEQGALDN